MKLLLLKESLKIQAGGAERVFSIIANNLAANGNEITILTFDKPEGSSFYPLDPKIKWILMNEQIIPSFFKKIVPSNFIRRIFVARKLISKKNFRSIIVLGDFMNIFSIILGKSLKIPVIISDRNNPKEKKLSRRFELFKKITYPLASSLVVMTDDQAKSYSKKMQKIITVIPNPVIKKDINTNSSKTLFEPPFILAIGKLMHQKGLDLLIQAFSMIANKNPDWNVIILGEGEDRNKLENMIIKLDLKNRIILPGILNNSSDALKDADIFVLPSRFEGFPNALGEAMAHGKPVIATDCDFGPRVMINNEVDGLLIKNNDIKLLAASIERLINDQKLRNKLGRNATKITNRYNVKNIMNLWYTLIKQVCDS